ncbi:MAG: DUF502 domain-containing protein [Alphaproteobacteria bacterium]|jgi:uncharacterized membrane protein|nr:DUF502 domain-containing protein [Alphaproteobacteria bacterium]
MPYWATCDDGVIAVWFGSFPVVSARKPRSPRRGPTPQHRGLGLFGRLRAYFFAGILVTAPLFITIYLAWLFITFIDDQVAGLVPDTFHPYLPFGVPGVGVLLVFAAMVFIGWFAAGFVGRILVQAQDRLLTRTPVVRNVYSALKQILETVMAHKSSAFREVVLLEYPRRGMWAIGFITGTTQGEVQHLTEDEVVNIFLPTTPNPTSGFLLFVPRNDLVVLDMTVEEGIKMVVSGGIVTPPDRRPPADREVPAVSTRLRGRGQAIEEWADEVAGRDSTNRASVRPSRGRQAEPAGAGKAPVSGTQT